MSSRNEIFRAPAGNRKYELESNRQQPHNAWICNRREYEQVLSYIKRFKEDYPQATQWQVMLAERAFKAAIFMQRIEDRRCFMDGSETGAQKVDKYYLEIDGESSKRWEREFEKWYWRFAKELRECLTMLMSEKIDLQITGSLSSLSEVFAKDDEAKQRIEKEVIRRLDGKEEQQ